MKRLTALILSLLLCVSLFACSDGVSDAPQTTAGPVIEDIVCKLSTDTDGFQNFKAHGRTELTKGGLVCDLSASGIEFNAYIEGDVTVELYVSAVCYFTLYVDGVRSEERIQVGKGTHTVKLAEFSNASVHNIRLVKQTESNRALCNIKEVSFRGYFAEAPAEKDLYIEFIGDSITAGYGNLCANGTEDPGSAAHQDATKAYAYLTAEALDADYSLVCCSGIGIVKGYTSYPMADFYAAASYHRSTSEAFKPTRTPDLIVINLGTNDNSKGSTHAELAEKVPVLIDLVQSTYGKDIPIIWVHGMMGEGKWTNISWVMTNTYDGENDGLYALEIAKNAQGGGSHPSGEAHITAAEALANYIKDKGLNK